MLIELTDANFQQEVVSKSNLVVVLVWAPWNAPSVLAQSLLDGLATEYAGRVITGKLNQDNNTKVIAQYYVRSVPTFLFVKNGQLVGSLMGAQTRDQLKNRIDANL